MSLILIHCLKHCSWFSVQLERGFDIRAVSCCCREKWTRSWRESMPACSSSRERTRTPACLQGRRTLSTMLCRSSQVVYASTAASVTSVPQVVLSAKSGRTEWFPAACLCTGSFLFSLSFSIFTFQKRAASLSLPSLFVGTNKAYHVSS